MRADVSRRDFCGRTPLHNFACGSRLTNQARAAADVRVGEMLTAAGADVQALCTCNRSELWYAVNTQTLPAVLLLTAYPAPAEVRLDIWHHAAGTVGALRMYKGRRGCRAVGDKVGEKHLPIVGR